ncbi:MAG: UDP-galactopyranose mutase [Bacteroidales bacterium]|nr:UDP-galactopyranose mutase [Bacteroidales bacterium]
MYDWLIVGAGLYGATFAHEARKRGLSCLVIEKRRHSGGNIYCENVDGINVHKYGAHIFHTSDQEVWRFVTGLVDFNRYTNCPVAKAPNGRMYNLPFNMNTFYQMWGCQTPTEAEAILAEQRREAVERMRREGIAEPRNLEEQALALIGRDIYEQLIKGYTEKQWGRPCNELPAFIIKRLPVRLTFDNNYFNDLHQGIPIGGYNPLIDRLLEGADVRLGEDFFERRDYWMSQAERVLFTGKIDQFYDYRFGRLEYRTVRFETETLDQPNYQGNAVINYTDAQVPYTRIIEHKHFESFGNAVYVNPRTVISREYSTEWTEGMEPYYPVNDHRNQALYDQYRALGAQEPRILFGGRLGEYKYYDMAPAIASAHRLANTLTH